jgi:solute carrier family 5 (sodium-coupled monocarboxylate transporter), member 8/12
VILEDFVKPFISKPLSEKQTALIMRSTVLFFGIVSVILVSVVEKLGSVLQLSMSVGAISLAPLLGIFVMGLFMPWINSKAALIGGICSFSVMATITLMAQTRLKTEYFLKL